MIKVSLVAVALIAFDGLDIAHVLTRSGSWTVGRSFELGGGLVILIGVFTVVTVYVRRLLRR